MSFRSLSTGAAVFSFLLVVAGGATAQTPQKGRGFRLFASAFSRIDVNRAWCGLAVTGEQCVDPDNSSTIGGGYWPKNSPQQYVFNSGLQVAGTIGAVPDWAWAGDTTGGFFFDPKGTTQHGQGVNGIWNYGVPADRAAWPAFARVPAGDGAASFFAASVQGRATASDQDLWSLNWEGDPNLSAGRAHPLGVAIETRVLAWKAPAGNDDIIYFLHTFYNISSACAADYAGVRPELRDTLVRLGERFHALNLAKSGVTIPPCGYPIQELYVGVAADPDVSSDGGSNYTSVNLPLAMGYAFEHTFRRPEGTYALPSEIGAPPFTNGYGFVGIKLLRAMGAQSVESAIKVYSATTGGGVMGDPANVYQLYRYLSGNIGAGLGDGACNYSVAVDRICFIKNDAASDVRFWQSTGSVAPIPPGGSVSVATAYIFASAVASPGCPVAGCGGGGTEVKPGDPTRLADAAGLATIGANLVDSMAGFRGFVDDGDGVVEGREFITVRGSLMQKAQLAQAVFDAGFVLPAAPEVPEFFLIPGDAKVSIFWRPTTTETTGDPYFTSTAAPWSPTSPLYDPNFRQFDVVGYRVYRGRTDDPTRMTLLTQVGYGSKDTEGHTTAFRDYLGVVSPSPRCAPELGLNTVAEGCPVNFDTPPQGTAYTVYREYDIHFGAFVQVRLGDRHLMATGDVYVTRADTAITGGGSGLPEFDPIGVQFSYVDETAVNDQRYFYAVTAFDLNSIQSGPSSLESARLLKTATPMHAASNFENSAVLASGIVGREKKMSEVITKTPRLDGVTGTFDGPARPATGATIGFLGDFAKELVTESGEISILLDSMHVGSVYDSAASTFYTTIITSEGSVPFSYAVAQDQLNGTVTASKPIDGGPVDADRVARYGGTSEYRLTAIASLSYPGAAYTASFGRGCANGFSGFSTGRCSYNGARWFDGANESFPHPTRGNNPNSPNPGTIAIRTNAGSLTGVANVYEARAYQTRPSFYREVEGVLGAAATGADYKLYWGTGGGVDSVVDVTHNVKVRFDTTMKNGYTWGFLTPTAASAVGSGDRRPGVLSVTDLGCVQPMKSYPAPNAHLLCQAGTTYHFVSTVSFGPLAFGNSVSADSSIAPAPNPGFGIYLAGHFFLMEMNSATPTAPAAGTVWTMRSYVGGISGGGSNVGSAGNQGPYFYVAVPSPFTAVGAKLSLSYEVTNAIAAATEADLDRVHTVPDPYYVTNGYATGDRGTGIKFVNLPDNAIVRIYSLSGVLVRVLEHSSQELGGSLDWDIRNRDGRLVSPGVYFYAIETVSGARRVGRMTIVNFLQ